MGCMPSWKPLAPIQDSRGHNWKGILITTIVQYIPALEEKERYSIPRAASIDKFLPSSAFLWIRNLVCPYGGKRLTKLTKKGTRIVFHYLTAQVSWQLHKVLFSLDSFPSFLRSNFRGFQADTLKKKKKYIYYGRRGGQSRSIVTLRFTLQINSFELQPGAMGSFKGIIWKQSGEGTLSSH